MNTNRLSTLEWVERVIFVLLFVAIGAVIIVVFSPLRPMLGRTDDYLGRIGMIVLLLLAVLWARKNSRFQRYELVLFGLLILAIAVSLDRFISVYLVDYLGVSDATAAGWAIPKLNECVVVISVVILLTRLSGGSLGSVYIQRGNLKLGLIVGVITFCLAAAGSTLMAALLFKGENLTLARIIVWLPWLLIFVLANATQEEILFRGLFLRKLQPFFGKFISNCLIALVFTALHKGAGYSSNEVIFLAVLVPLALVWGYLMQKTDSVWGSILFHAGMDIPIMLGIFSNL